MDLFLPICKYVLYGSYNVADLEAYVNSHLACHVALPIKTLTGTFALPILLRPRQHLAQHPLAATAISAQHDAAVSVTLDSHLTHMAAARPCWPYVARLARDLVTPGLPSRLESR